MARTRVQRDNQGNPEKQQTDEANQQAQGQTKDEAEDHDFMVSPDPPCKAMSISWPNYAENRKSCYHFVEYNHRPFSVTWEGPVQSSPDLEGFPFLKDADVSPVRQTPKMAAIWRGSKLLAYGAHAHIRITEHEHNPFPVLKLAHSDELSLNLIQNEFNVLADMAKAKLPVVEFDQQPIVDNGVMCGYRMKKLVKPEYTGFRSQRADEVKHALDRFHSAGFCHGDLKLGNIMTDESDRIILIDYGYAGRLGSAIPPFFPAWAYGNGIFGIDLDLEDFRQHIDPRNIRIIPHANIAHMKQTEKS